ncbi:hypothetical protein [Clavibacter michiganensis]|uniref:hypothetical protein n=1 Tax=Clavibacter michiganensis TaxID=28447 RepID=UPI001184A28E|nr:hypothetical protein [Clavibacter michiganensis]
MVAVLVLSAPLTAGCSSSATHRDSDQKTEANAATASPDDAAKFAALHAAVNRAYEMREAAGDFSRRDGGAILIEPGQNGAASVRADAGDITVTVPASTDPATKQIIVTARCSGSDEFRITIQQEHPNTVGTSCGVDEAAVFAVPLDDRQGQTTLAADFPADGDFWASTFYTTE